MRWLYFSISALHTGYESVSPLKSLETGSNGLKSGAQKIVPLGKSSQKEKRKMLPFFKIVKNRTGKSSQN